MKKGIASLEGWDKQKNGELYGKQTVKDAPLRWKSAPDHPETHLAYITGEEAALLKQLDLHDSGVRYEDHFGPRGIPSYNGAGAGDSEGGATAGGETGGPGPGGGSSTGDSGNAADSNTGNGGNTDNTDTNTGLSGLYGSGDQGYGNVGGFSNLSTVGPNTDSFTGSIGSQSIPGVGPSTTAGFGLSGPETGRSGMNVGNAMADLGLGITTGVGFSPSGIVGTSFADESGVAGGLANALAGYDWSGMTFGPPATPSAIGLTTSIPGYSLTNYSQQMTTPSQMSITPGIVSTMGNPAVANSVGVMGPSGMAALAGLSAIDSGLSALGAGGRSISGGYGVAYGPTVESIVGGVTSPSAPTATAAAPSATTTTAAPAATTAPSTTTAPSQTQVATAPPAPTSMLDAVADRFSQALNNPISTAVNIGIGMVPGIGLANTVSGLLGGPTVGGLAQSAANAITSGNFGTTTGYTDTENVGFGESPEYSAVASAPQPQSVSSPAVGIASLSPVSYDVSNFSSPGLMGLTQPSYSSPVGYTGPNSVSMAPGFNLGDIAGTYSYTPA